MSANNIIILRQKVVKSFLKIITLSSFHIYYIAIFRPDLCLELLHIRFLSRIGRKKEVKRLPFDTALLPIQMMKAQGQRMSRKSYSSFLTIPKKYSRLRLGL